MVGRDGERWKGEVAGGKLWGAMPRRKMGREAGGRGRETASPDLVAKAFLVLRDAFFARDGEARLFALRDKRNTQDDPFDEYVCKSLNERLREDAVCVGAPGPLITPDMVVMRPELCGVATRAELADDLSRIVGLEVKKLERIRTGGVARASGMDYNTTPPCGRVRVYDSLRQAVDIRGFYMFVCQEAVEDEPRHYRLSALALCDGNVLNEDFGYYLSVVGQRTKRVGLGTYGNGADRARPMLIFANPLGAAELDHEVTLIHPRRDLAAELSQLRCVGVIRRTVGGGGERTFYCYRLMSDVPREHEDFELTDPFPLPARTEKTQPRGRFLMNWKPSD